MAGKIGGGDRASFTSMSTSHIKTELPRVNSGHSETHTPLNRIQQGEPMPPIDLKPIVISSGTETPRVELDPEKNTEKPVYELLGLSLDDLNLLQKKCPDWAKLYGKLTKIPGKNRLKGINSDDVCRMVNMLDGVGLQRAAYELMLNVSPLKRVPAIGLMLRNIRLARGLSASPGSEFPHMRGLISKT